MPRRDLEAIPANVFSAPVPVRLHGGLVYLPRCVRIVALCSPISWPARSIWRMRSGVLPGSFAALSTL